LVTRRKFLLRDAPAAAAGLAAALQRDFWAYANGGKTMSGPVYELATTRLQFGVQVSYLLEWMEKRALPLLVKYRFGPMGFFTVEVGSHIPAVVSIRAHPSLAEMEAVWARVSADSEWAAARSELEASGPAFDREDDALLLATAFSPPLKAAGPGEPAHKIIELRIYESPTFKQLGYLHDRFAGGEIEIFHKCGIHPILYADTIHGPNRPNMVYLIPFESEAHREAAWTAFRNDPDWQRMRDESIRCGGEIVRNVTNMILVPTSFSMIR
jgi:hypothetical protein